MIRKKSSFLTFIFSLLPGAGQMYMGFMKRGMSLMAAFFLFIFLGAWLEMGLLMLTLPIIWFYSFFDTHNLRSTPDDEFYALEDKYILFPEIGSDNLKLLQGKYRNIFAAVLIIIGITILWNNLFDMLRMILPYYIRDMFSMFSYYFPQLLIGFGIILLGIYLIRGKKKELDLEDKVSMLEDKGGKQL
jgi:hypothetical protein